MPPLPRPFSRLASTRLDPGARTALRVVLALLLILPAAWITHVVHCLQQEEYGFLIAGALMFPVAVVHGIGLWFGFFGG